MIPNIPWYITTATIAVSLLILPLGWYLVRRGAGRAELGAATTRRLSRLTLLGLGGWLALVALLAPPLASLAGGDPYQLTLLIPLSGLAGFAGVALALWRSPDLRRALLAIPMAEVVGVQYYRVVGAVFVVLLSLGQLPAHFARPAGWGDVAVGLLAPVVALLLIRAPAVGRGVAYAWNALGLVDLMVAVGMGTGLLAPILMPELGTRVPAAEAMGAFPMILIPAFAVPVSMLLHLLGFVQLRRSALSGSGVDGRLLEAAGR